MDLLDLFQDLVPLPPEAGSLRLSVAQVPGAPRYYLGRNPDGCPVILVPSGKGSEDLLQVELQNLSIVHDALCRLSLPGGGEETGRYTVISCLGDVELRPLFLRLMSGLMATMGQEPTRQSLARAVAGLVELFRAMSRPPRKSTQGLWSELLVIAKASDPALLLDAWHADPGELWDFNGGSGRLEVKSCSGRERRHHFSLDQLSPPAGSELVVASMFVELAGGGTEIASLVRSIRDQVAAQPRLIWRLESVVAETLGSAWASANRVRFDIERASASLRFYASQDIPRIQMEHVPPAISAVRFEADLTAVAPLALTSMAKREGILAGAVPTEPHRTSRR